MNGAAPAPTIPVEATVVAETPKPQPAQAAPACQAVVPIGCTSVESTTGFFDGGFVPSLRDVILPRLNVAQNIGEIGKNWAPGSLVWDAQGNGVCLWHPPVVKNNVVEKNSPPPVIMCVLDFYPLRYVEKVQGGAGMIVNTEAAVRENGGTLDYREWEMKKGAGMRLFQYLADAIIAVRRPGHVADDDMVFNFPVGNEKYTLGLFSMKGASYTAACKGGWFRDRSTGCLRIGGYPTWHYNLTARLKPFGEGKEAWVPVPIPSHKSPPEFLDFAKSLMRRPAPQSE